MFIVSNISCLSSRVGVLFIGALPYTLLFLYRQERLRVLTSSRSQQRLNYLLNHGLQNLALSLQH